MSKQDRSGAWVVPPSQVTEFMTKQVDYDKLIKACIESPKQQTKVKKPVKVLPVEDEIVLEIDDAEYLASERKKSIWSRDLRTVFKK